jgi:D-3-phosphoglycerate dehydrogenase
MKNSAILINTARGSLVKEADLIEGLMNGSLAGAALDVFEHEPLPVSSPLRSMDNVLLSSHNVNVSPYHWKRVHRNTIDMLYKGLGISNPTIL